MAAHRRRSDRRSARDHQPGRRPEQGDGARARRQRQAQPGQPEVRGGEDGEARPERIPPGRSRARPAGEPEEVGHGRCRVRPTRVVDAAGPLRILPRRRTSRSPSPGDGPGPSASSRVGGPGGARLGAPRSTSLAQRRPPGSGSRRRRGCFHRSPGRHGRGGNLGSRTDRRFVAGGGSRNTHRGWTMKRAACPAAGLSLPVGRAGQNIVLSLAAVSGTGCSTSQCSTILPSPSSRKMSMPA